MPKSGDALPVSAARMCSTLAVGSGSAYTVAADPHGPVDPGKLMSCESGPFGLVLLVGSEPASAESGKTPFRRSTMLMRWTS